MRTGNLPLLIERGDINADQATKVAAVFNSPEKLAELETVGLQDATTIRLKVGDVEKDSAMLHEGLVGSNFFGHRLIEPGPNGLAQHLVKQIRRFSFFALQEGVSQFFVDHGGWFWF